MFATIRRIALALAGAAALAAAGKARADHDLDRPCPPAYQPPVYQQDYQPPVYPQDYRPQDYQPPVYRQEQPPVYPRDDRGWQPQPEQVYTEAWSPPLRAPGASLSFTVALPPPPAWLAVAPPPVPAYGAWSRREIEREYRWLDMARVRFYRFGAANPWRVRQFEAWYQLRRAGLDRRWAALAWAPGPERGWQGWRDGGWHGRGEGWGRGRWDRERWERDD